VAAKDRASVDAFFRAAVAAGGKDNGPPGCVRTITRTITVRLYMIPMDTTSRRSATQHVKTNGIRANIWPLAEILLTSTNVCFGGEKWTLRGPAGHVWF